MSGLSERHLAMFASGAYESPDIAHNIAKEVGNDWGIDRDLTNHHSTVYRNENTKHTVVSFRGTKDRNDLKTDSLLFLGLLGKSQRVKDANALTEKIISKYGKDNLELASHSLGANIGSSVSKKTGIPTTSFSKGKTLLPSKNAANEKVIRNVLDPFSGNAIIPSAFSLPNLLIGGTGRLPKNINPHSLNNFI